MGTVRVDMSHPVNSLWPSRSLGSSMDILPQGAVDKIYTPEILRQSLSAGWGPITYRQNTELQIAAWHWNPNGTWSDAQNQSGYFTGTAQPTEELRHSYAYPLPHRGTTRNGGAERGYSKLTDGNPQTYWKSNPYLTREFTGEDDALHPQWIVIDLGAVMDIDALKIDWASPYAMTYEIQYFTGAEPMNKPTEGVWAAFPTGIVSNGQGGSVTHRLSASPLKTRFIRIWMTHSSNTCDPHKPASDRRNCVGYAIAELYVGTLVPGGMLVDLVQHQPDEGQTATFCSSIDPWHAASDLNLPSGDQTGFDLFYTSGITNHLPAMIPVAMLYGIPEDAAAQIAYLRQRGYPISFLELGEEPDGQYMLPEDYGALYLQFASAIHRVDAGLKLGGPIFQGVNEDIQVWPDEQGRTSWLGRFLDYLKAHGRLNDLAFMSFEHYPFNPCEVTWMDLYREPELVRHILQVWRDDGLPANVPMMITESNLSWGLTQAMTEIFAALWLADNAGAFFAAGGAVFYHSPIQPEPLRPGCRGHSTFGNFVADGNFQVRQYTSQYYASRMITLEWVKPGDGEHRVFGASCDLQDGAGHQLVTAYPLERPDGQWSVMLVNRDQSNARAVRVVFEDGGPGRQRGFTGTVEMVNYGSEQYVWHSAGPDSHAEPDEPPAKRTQQVASGAVFTLPKASITVLRGRIT